MNKIFNQKGGALVMALAAALGLGALSLVFLQRTKIQNRINTKYQTDNDADVAVLNLTAHLLKPKNCTATFHGKAVPLIPDDTTANANNGTAIATGIYTCNAADCITAAGRALTYPVMAKSNTNWTTAQTGFPGPGNSPSSKIRLVGMKYWLNTNQTYYTGPSAKGTPAVLRVQLVFEKHLGYTNVPHPTIAGQFDAVLKTSVVLRDIFVPVVRGTDRPSNPGYISSASILGCPRSPNSTIVYSSP